MDNQKLIKLLIKIKSSQLKTFLSDVKMNKAN